MYKELLRSIAGIEVFPIISLCVFVAVFGASVFYAMRLDRRRVAQLSRLPLEDQSADPNRKEVLL